MIQNKSIECKMHSLHFRLKQSTPNYWALHNTVLELTDISMCMLSKNTWLPQTEKWSLRQNC